MANPAPLEDRGAHESAEAVPSQQSENLKPNKVPSPQPPNTFVELWGVCGRMMNHGHRPYINQRETEPASA